MKRINLLVAKINYPDSPTVVRFHTLQPEANNLRASKNQATVGLFSLFVLFVIAARLAQLVRALDCGGEGRGLDSNTQYSGS